MFRREDKHKFSKTSEIDSLSHFAQYMRNHPTPAEAAMNEILRKVNREFPDYIFYCQHIQPPHIIDFYCPQLSLGIEVDSHMHFNDVQREKDIIRDGELAEMGIRIERYSNDEVLNNRRKTMAKIYSLIKKPDEI